MGVIVVHLSDFHFSEQNQSMHFKKIQPLMNSLSNLANKKDQLLIIVSGDIAYSGRKNEYQLAENFFQKLRVGLKAYFKRVDLYFVAGNHDCDFTDSKNLNTRSRKIEEIRTQGYDLREEDIHFLKEIQVEYELFEQKNSTYTTKFSLLQKKKIILNGSLQINLNLINTSWMSSLNEEKSILMSTKYFNFDSSLIEGADKMINLYVYHHPRSWFTSDDDHSVREMIERKGGIILTGHEHVDDAHVKITKKSDLLYSVCGSFDGESSVFNVITLKDEMTSEQTFKWNNEYGIFEKKSDVKHEKDFKVVNLYTPSQSYITFLDELGMLVAHPRKKTITLNDLFVNPFLSMSISKKMGHEIRIKDDDTISTLCSESKCIVDGDYGSGKTSLAKILIRELIRNEKFVVIYVDVSVDKNAFNTSARLRNHFNTILTNQYGKQMASMFTSIPKEKKVIVVDNYHHLFERENNISLLHDFMKDSFDKIIIFSNSKEGISANLKIDRYILDFNRYKIEAFGKKLQTKIIKRWNEINVTDVNDEEVNRKNRDDAALIKTLLEGNNLPQTPDVILTILSLGQTKKADKTTLYGHLLTNIISNAMERSDIDGDSQEETFRILSTFAFSLYEKEVRKLDYTSFKDIVNSDNHTFGLTNSAEKVLNQLSISNILQIEDKMPNHGSMDEINCNVSFRYNYLYSYFVARHFSKNLKDLQILNEIDNLLDQINFEDSSRIIINIWYFSNDGVLLEKLDRKIKKTLLNCKIFDFNNPPKIIGDLNRNKQDILLNLKGIDENLVEKNRDDFLEHEEEKTYKKSHDVKSYNEKKESDQLEIIELNTVFNLIATIGQIIKCYGGSIIVEEKEYLINSCYELGMKSLSFIYDMLKESDFIEYAKDVIQSDSSLSTEEAYDAAIKNVSFLLQVTSYSSVIRISDALSSAKIAPTLKNYVSNHNTIGLRLVDIGVSFLFLNNEKVSAAEELISDSKNDFLTQSILRIIIWKYYFYNIGRSKPDKDRLLSKLEIKNVNRLLISNNS